MDLMQDHAAINTPIIKNLETLQGNSNGAAGNGKRPVRFSGTI
jgi:hypothetical protein